MRYLEDNAQREGCLCVIWKITRVFDDRIEACYKVNKILDFIFIKGISFDNIPNEMSN